ncbi:MAG: methyltransferase domain-containing protein [Fimbriimonadaceae bacterium]
MNERQVAVLAEAQHLAATAKNIGKLGDKYSPEYSRWAFGQWEMRKRGREKFTRAAMMQFTRQGLEMATHERIAAYHASLFPTGVEVLDAGCGIGADLMALGARGPVVGVDNNREHVNCARHNLSVYGFKGKVGRGDALDVLAKGWDFVFCDPGRRDDGQRLISPDDYQPNVEALRQYLKRAKRGVIKLSPMLRDEYLLGLGGDVRFLSYGRECREALVVFPGKKRVSAVHIESGEEVFATPLEGTVTEPVGYLYEADPALIRAHGLGHFEMDGVGDSNGYLTSKSLVESPWLRRYEVLWSGPWRIRMVKDALREGGWQVDAVKKRGIKVEPASVLRQVEVDRGDPVQLVMYAIGAKVAVALVRVL